MLGRSHFCFSLSLSLVMMITHLAADSKELPADCNAQHQHQHQNYRNWQNPFLGGVSGVATARGGKVSPLPVERSPTLLTHISPSSPRSHPTYTKPSKPPHWFLLPQTSPSFWVQIPLPSNALDSHPVAWWKSYSTDLAHTKPPPLPLPPFSE